jgi:chromosome segregation ATPase
LAATKLAVNNGAESVTSSTAGKEDDDESYVMDWKQLESRASALEQVLTEVNESNFELHQRIERLSKNKKELVRQLDKLQKSDLGKQVVALQKENSMLKARLLKVESELAKAHRQDASSIGSPRSKALTLDDITARSPKTPIIRRHVMERISEIRQAVHSPRSPANSQSTDTESLDSPTEAGNASRSPYAFKKNPYDAQHLQAPFVAALDDSMPMDDLDFGVKSEKCLQGSSTSMTESSYSILSSHSFLSSKQYSKVVDDNRKLKDELVEINRSYRQQRTQLQRLEAYVDELEQKGIESAESDAECSESASKATVLSYVSEGDEYTDVMASEVARLGRLSRHGERKGAKTMLNQDIEFVPTP